MAEIKTPGEWGLGSAKGAGNILRVEGCGLRVEGLRFRV